MPTLGHAKKLAEEYYKEWLRVNHNLDTEGKTIYPLAKRLEGIADGNSIKRIDNKNGI
jgi:hypothetical protein